MSYFRVQNLSAGYGGKNIIVNLSFSVDKGEILGILGTNGCGKTTLLKSICGILKHTGSCLLDGREFEKMGVRALAKQCSYIPQRSGIEIDIPVMDVVLMAFNPHLGMLAQPDTQMRRRAAEVLAETGMDIYAAVNFQKLSEGQKQLCILARALAADAPLMLLDEPESALDFRFRYRMFSLLRTRTSAQQSAAIAVLHDPQLALNCCDAILLIKDGQNCGIIRPGSDTLEDAEAKLSQIYGEIRLHKCCDRSGKEHIVMIKDDSYTEEVLR